MPTVLRKPGVKANKEWFSLADISKIASKKNQTQKFVDDLNYFMEKFKINTKKRVAHFIAQCIVETSYFNTSLEDMRYRTAERIAKVFPGKFAEARKSGKPRNPSEFVNKPMRLGNFVYANKNGNSDEESGQGYKYRGAGFIQMTGRDKYISFLAYTSDSDIFIYGAEHVSKYYACASSCFTWAILLKLNDVADQASSADDVTKIVNYYTDTYKKRRDAYNLVWSIIKNK
jgi:putative chitinase